MMMQQQVKGFTQLSQEERIEIYHYLRDGLSLRAIAKHLSRHHTTISREFKRNSIDYGYDNLKYKPLEAEKKKNKRRKKANHSHIKLIKNRYLGIRLYEILKDKGHTWGPDEIIGRIISEGGLSISTSTLYRYIYQYEPSRRRFLRYKGFGYRRRYTASKKGGAYKDIPLITERSKESELREEIGHRESDTIVNKLGTSGGLVTMVDRKSRYLLSIQVPNLKGDTVYRAMKYLLYNETVKSLIIDNGTEFSKIRKSKKEGIELFRCNAYASYEKGSNERSNGMIRRSIPKGCNTNQYSQEEVKNIVNNLNHKPRKILGYRTPYEVYHNTKLSYLN